KPVKELPPEAMPKIANAADSTLRAPDPYAQHTAPLEKMRAILNDARQQGVGAAIDPQINKA
ncbi:hypothetical protein, partial [Escherichia coli]|uniref:hypothetical protein n=1 Tax=Escherichia coli TaxID=562 RepID=UPI001BDCF61E